MRGKDGGGRGGGTAVGATCEGGGGGAVGGLLKEADGDRPVDGTGIAGFLPTTGGFFLPAPSKDDGPVGRSDVDEAPPSGGRS